MHPQKFLDQSRVTERKASRSGSPAGSLRRVSGVRPELVFASFSRSGLGCGFLLGIIRLLLLVAIVSSDTGLVSMVKRYNPNAFSDNESVRIDPTMYSIR